MKRLGIGCLVAVGLLIVLGIIVSLSSSGGTPAARTQTAVARGAPPSATTAPASPVVGTDEATEVLAVTASPADTPAPPADTAVPATPESQPPTETPEPTAAPEQGTTENPYPPDAVVTLGNARWTLVKTGKATSLPASFGEPKTTQNMFVVVVIQIENIGNEGLRLSPLGLIDDKGREFDQSSSGFKLDPEAVSFTTLNPGLTLAYSNVYEVPKDATGFVVNISDTVMFGKSALIALGELPEWAP